MVFRFLALFFAVFSAFGAEVAGVTLPDTDQQLVLNGAGLPILGEDFYRALLKIWLGDKPVQADLKKALLGEKQ
jgi:hypothetical protein